VGPGRARRHRGRRVTTVLVADDDADIRALVTRKLELAGYQVIAVGDGCAALEAAVACAPDVVLLDVTMPGLDGVEVCRRLRARPDFGAVPILLLTAQAQEADVARGRAMGADDYVVKPFSPRELLRRVQDALDRRSTTAHPVVAGISSDRRTPG